MLSIQENIVYYYYLHTHKTPYYINQQKRIVFVIIIFLNRVFIHEFRSNTIDRFIRLHLGVAKN